MSDSTDNARLELGSNSCPGAHREVESSEAQLSSTGEQITCPLVSKVNRDGTGLPDLLYQQIVSVARQVKGLVFLYQVQC
jgi:hypothetical protein